MGRADEVREVLEPGDLGEKLLPGDGVAADPRPLRLVERALPVEEAGVDRQLADVVEHGDELDLGRVERPEAEPLGHVARQRRETVAVVGRRRVMQAQLTGERVDGLRHPRRVGERRQWAHHPMVGVCAHLGAIGHRGCMHATISSYRRWARWRVCRSG